MKFLNKESVSFMHYDCPLEWWSPRPGFDPTLLLLIAWLLSCLANNPFQPQISNLWHRDSKTFLPRGVGAKMKWHKAHKVTLVPGFFGLFCFCFWIFGTSYDSSARDWSVDKVKRKSWQENINTEIEKWPGGLILKHCFSWTNVFSGVVLCCG